MTPATNWFKADGARYGFGILSDAVFGGSSYSSVYATDLQLTTAWGVNAAYEHFWSKQVKTSLYGGYAAVSYNDTANNILCNGHPHTVTSGCDNDWNTWWIGSRTQFNLDAATYLGVDILYGKLMSATRGPWYQQYYETDPDQVMVRGRVHHDFYP
jgi:hypothetical protein